MIDVNKQLNLNGTLAATFLKPAEEEKLYVLFVYSPQTIFNHTQGQVFLLINSDMININKKDKNQHL